MQANGYRSVLLAFGMLCTERAKAFHAFAERREQLQQIVSRKLERQSG